MAYSKIWVASNQMLQIVATKSEDIKNDLGAGESFEFECFYGNKHFANTDYRITATAITTNAGAEVYVTEKTTSGCKVKVYNRNSSTTISSVSIDVIAMGEAYNRGA